MAKPSWSASMGSWCVQLVRKPRNPSARKVRKATRATKPAEAKVSYAPSLCEAALLYPALVAVFLCVSSALFSLSRFVMLPNIGLYLEGSLAVALVIVLTAHCGPKPLRSLCRAIRYPLLLGWLLFGFSLIKSKQAPGGANLDINGLLALVLGFFAVASVLLIGARTWGRAVSLSAPLVPTISLYAVLGLVSVDPVIPICFLVFALGAFYLFSYRAFLRTFVPEMATGTFRNQLIVTPERPTVFKWTVQSILVGSFWLCLFGLGGVVLFVPVKLFLPGLVAPQITKIRAAAQQIGPDYRSNDTSLKLHGGMRTLSDREAVRITVQSGQSSGLWREQVYNDYEDGQWKQANPYYLIGQRLPMNMQMPVDRSADYQQGRFVDSDRRENFLVDRRVRHLNQRLGTVEPVLELVEPRSDASDSIIASGDIIEWKPQANLSSSTTLQGGRLPYLVKSTYVEPRLSSLDEAPGYEARWGNHPPEELAQALQKPSDKQVARQIEAISRQVHWGEKSQPQTPYQKVRAVSAFLSVHCIYSLETPEIPASADPVVFFLTDAQRGACDMFASSMVLLLRDMNVPARLVSGYLQDEETVLPSGDGHVVYGVRERDAHAWVEYYVPRYGWLAYDPTANTRTDGEGLAAKVSDWFALPTWSFSASVWKTPFYAGLLALVGLLALQVETRWRNRPRSDEERRQRRVLESYATARRLLRTRVKDGAHLSPREYEARISQAHLPLDAKQEFAALTHLYELLHYGAIIEVTEAEVRDSLKRFRIGLQRRVF